MGGLAKAAGRARLNFGDLSRRTRPLMPSQAAVLGMGFDALILAFVVVVIGGLGSLQGALVGALIVSFVRTAGIQFFSEVELAVLYLIAAVVLPVKPTGLFGDA